MHLSSRLRTNIRKRSKLLLFYLHILLGDISVFVSSFSHAHMKEQHRFFREDVSRIISEHVL